MRRQGKYRSTMAAKPPELCRGWHIRRHIMKVYQCKITPQNMKNTLRTIEKAYCICKTHTSANQKLEFENLIPRENLEFLEYSSILYEDMINKLFQFPTPVYLVHLLCAIKYNLPTISGVHLNL